MHRLIDGCGGHMSNLLDGKRDDSIACRRGSNRAHLPMMTFAQTTEPAIESEPAAATAAEATAHTIVGLSHAQTDCILGREWTLKGPNAEIYRNGWACCAADNWALLQRSGAVF